jgi:hypothetical protein
MGLAAGLIWSAVAPRVQYQMVTAHPPTAYATNPETSAFIAADGWYCLIGLVGGALIGLLAYWLAIRRYGPLPMAGAIIGSVAAAFIAKWLGHQASGGPGFNNVLATSKPGSYLYAPISLGSHGALAFWPLAAAAVAGGIGLVSALRGRHQVPYAGVPMPGMDSFGTRPYQPERPDPGQTQFLGSGFPAAGSPAAGSPAAGSPGAGSSATSAHPGADGYGYLGSPDPQGDRQGPDDPLRASE